MKHNDVEARRKHLKNEEIRHYLKTLRESLGLSQEEMADKVRVSESDYRANYLNMENGKKPVTKPVLKRIGQVFGDWSLWWLYMESNYQETAKYLLDNEDREALRDLIAMVRKHFYEGNKNTSPFLNENLQRFMEAWGYSFEWYASRTAVQVTRDDKHIDLDADEQLALTSAIKDAIDRFFDSKLLEAEMNGEDVK